MTGHQHTGHDLGGYNQAKSPLTVSIQPLALIGVTYQPKELQLPGDITLVTVQPITDAQGGSRIGNAAEVFLQPITLATVSPSRAAPGNRRAILYPRDPECFGLA